MSERPPVLLVHGIWDTGAKLDVLRAGLVRAGLSPVHTIDLAPNDGRAPIPDLARQVRDRARDILRIHGAARLDLVGFSMGALVSRYFVQRLGGRELVRRFVSVSGPHGGTAMAAFHPAWFRGVHDMRPGSALLRELASDPDPWGGVEVHVIYTPYDLMIVPARSSELPGARSTTRLPMPLHRLMIVHPRAVAAVATKLR